MGKFLKLGDRTGKPLIMDKKNIFIEKAGKRYNIYDAVQEANVDTDIYKTMEKYGSLERMVINKKQVFADVSEMKDMRSLYDQDKKSKEIWLNLPLEIRQQFNNDRFLFAKEGENWLKEKIKAETKKEAPKKETATEPTKKEITKNEQK